MKDWRRSPEPPGMMGMPGAGSRYHESLDSSSTAESTLILERHPLSDALRSPAAEAADPVPTASAIHDAVVRAVPSLSAPLGNGVLPPGAVPGEGLYTLRNMCKRIVIRNIRSLTSVGDMPFKLVKEILERCRPSQLIMIEDNSPHLLAHTNEMWQAHCLRDYVQIKRSWDEGGMKTPKSWRKLYLRTFGAAEAAKAAAGARLKEKYDKMRAAKEEKQTAVVKPILRKARVIGSSSTRPSLTKGQSMVHKARSASKAHARFTAVPKSLSLAGNDYATAQRSLASPTARGSPSMTSGLSRVSTTSITSEAQPLKRPSSPSSTPIKRPRLASHSSETAMKLPSPSTSKGSQQSAAPAAHCLPQHPHAASIFMPRRRVPSQLPRR